MLDAFLIFLEKPHAFFVLAAYGVAAVFILLLIGMTLWRSARLKAVLMKDMPARDKAGVKRGD